MNAADCLTGQRFRIADAVVGVNCPPMHPLCRCKVTTPQEMLEDIQADIDRMLGDMSIEELEQRLDTMIEEKEALPESDSTLKSVEEKEVKGIFNNELDNPPLDKSEESAIIDAYKGKSVTAFPKAEILQEVVSRVENATKKITSDFKILEKMSEGITFGDVEGNALGINRYIPSTGKDTITLLKNGFANPEMLLQRLKEDYKSGESYDTDYIESLVAHEMGHNAHVALALKRVGLEYGKPLGPIEQELFDKEYVKIQHEIYEAAFKDESFTEIQDICAGQLGEMTRGNARELIAQSFGNYYYGNAKSVVGKKIVKYFKKGLK